MSNSFRCPIPFVAQTPLQSDSHSKQGSHHTILSFITWLYLKGFIEKIACFFKNIHGINQQYKQKQKIIFDGFFYVIRRFFYVIRHSETLLLVYFL